MGKLLQFVDHAQFLGYSERGNDHIDILAKVVFKDGLSPDDISLTGDFMEVVEVLTAPQSSWSKEWVLQIRFNAEASDLVDVHTRARSASITPESTLDQGGLNYIVRGPPQSVGMVVAALRMSLKPDRFSALSVEPNKILENRLVSPQQLRVVKSAWDAGWYENPRSLKMADLAREIGLSRSTVSEHLHGVETEMVKLLLNAVGEHVDDDAMKETYPLDFMWANIHPDDFQMVRKITDDSIRNREPNIIVFRVRKLNSKEYRLVRTNSNPYYENGDYVKMHGTVEDLSGHQDAAKVMKLNSKEYRLVRTNSNPYYENGDYVKMHGTVEDLSGHQDAAEVMKLSMKIANNQKNTTEFQNYGVWNWDIKEDIFEWSDYLYDITGVALGEFDPAGVGFYNLLEPSFVDEVRIKRDEALRTLESFEVEFNVIRPDNGETRIIRALGSVATDSKGNAVRLMGLASDVTGLTEAERTYQDTLMGDQNKLAGERGPYVVDAIKRTMKLSPEAKRILGN
jgi:PAS domain-containing protein